MKFLKQLQILLIGLSLLLPYSVQAIDPSSLSANELSVADKLGLSDSDLRALDKDVLKEKLKEKLNEEVDAVKEEAQEKLQALVDEKIEPKLAELKAKVEKEKSEVKEDLENLKKGYITSSISLFAASLIAPQVVMVCKTKPSAVIYAGTAAVYILQEMMNIKVFKASQLAEIEVVDKITVDQTKSMKENAKMLEDKVDQQIGYLKAYKGTLDNTIKALKKKVKNAKMVSVGFLAASATAAAEQMDWISGGGSCVMSASIDKINFSKKLDTKYAHLIEEAKTNEAKWAYYYEWESQKFGTERTLGLVEYDHLKNFPIKNSILIGAINLIHSQLVASAFAAEDSKKVTVAASLKNNKAADWIGDLDKLGIVGGVAINIVAYMTGWQMGFLKGVIASGTSRAVVFGAQGAMAFAAAKLFEKATTDLEAKLAKIEKLINQTQTVAKKGINFLVPSDTDAKNFQKAMTKFGVASDKLITEMSINEAQDYLKQIKARWHELDDEGRAMLKKYEAELNDKIKAAKEKGEVKIEEKVEDLKDKALELKEKIETKTESMTTSFISFLFQPLYAAVGTPTPTLVTRIKDINCTTQNTCPDLIFPKANNPNLKPLNQYLSFYENYYQGIKSNNRALEERAYDVLDKNKEAFAQYRSAVFKKAQEKGKAQNTDYNQFEQAKMAEETNNFSKFFKTLSEKDKKEFEASFNPLSTNYGAFHSGMNVNSGTKKHPKTNAEERRILSLLISRLEAASITPGSGPDMSFVEKDSQPTDQYNYGNTNIHPKDGDLFEIIHIRYQKVFKDQSNL